MMNIKKYSLLLLMCVQTAGLSALKVAPANFRRGTSSSSTVVQKPTAEQIAAYRQYMAAQSQADSKVVCVAKRLGSYFLGCVPGIVGMATLATFSAGINYFLESKSKSFLKNKGFVFSENGKPSTVSAFLAATFANSVVKDYTSSLMRPMFQGLQQII